jgi:hypothetical protein
MRMQSNACQRGFGDGPPGLSEMNLIPFPPDLLFAIELARARDQPFDRQPLAEDRKHHHGVGERED